MPSPPKSALAFRVVRKRLADGTTKEYRYPRQPAAGAPRDSLGALLAAYRASPEYRRLAAATVAQYRIYLRPWDDDRMACVAARSVTRRMVLTVRDAIAARSGNGAATAFGRITAALFGWAVDREWIDHSPAYRLKPLPGGELAAWTEAQIATALAGLPEPYRRVVVLGLYTGQRRGDLCAMGWGQFDGHAIRVRQRKTGAEVTIRCHPALLAELTAWQTARTATTILTAPRGTPWTDQHLSRAMSHALVAIGLPKGLNVHGLRKAAARRLAEAGCSAHEIAAVTGHRTLGMVAHYTRSADQERLADAAIRRLGGQRLKPDKEAVVIPLKLKAKS